MTKLIAKDRNNKFIRSWEINQKIETQLYSLKQKVEAMNIPLSIPVLLYAKDALNTKIEQDISSLDITIQQFQDIAQFSKICQEIEQLPKNNEIKLIIQK